MQFTTGNTTYILCPWKYSICNHMSIDTWAFGVLILCYMIHSKYHKTRTTKTIIKPYIHEDKYSPNKRKICNHFIDIQNTSIIVDMFSILEEVHYTASRSTSNNSQLTERCLELLQSYPKTINHVMPPKLFTPFLRACSSGSIAVVEYMLLNGADVSSKTYNGDTALILATHSVKFNPQDTSLLELLVQYGCNVNTANIDGCTPLHIAAKSGNLKLIWWLIENGGNVNAKMKNGLKPADIAQAFKHTNVAKFLSKPLIK